MTDAEKISLVKAISDARDDDTISAFLIKAKYAILNRMYAAWSDWPENSEVPDRYAAEQCDLAVRYYNRQGGEGEVSHNENGINRTWESPDDADILRRITPICEVPN